MSCSGHDSSIAQAAKRWQRQRHAHADGKSDHWMCTHCQQDNFQWRTDCPKCGLKKDHQKRRRTPTPPQRSAVSHPKDKPAAPAASTSGPFGLVLQPVLTPLLSQPTPHSAHAGSGSQTNSRATTVPHGPSAAPTVVAGAAGDPVFTARMKAELQTRAVGGGSAESAQPKLGETADPRTITDKELTLPQKEALQASLRAGEAALKAISDYRDTYCRDEWIHRSKRVADITIALRELQPLACRISRVEDSLAKSHKRSEELREVLAQIYQELEDSVKETRELEAVLKTLNARQNSALPPTASSGSHGRLFSQMASQRKELASEPQGATKKQFMVLAAAAEQGVQELGETPSPVQAASHP